MNVASLEERVARIEGILEQMNKRLNNFENELGGLRNHTESGLNELRRNLNNRFSRLLGVQISMWITIILAILFR
jgi:tetrahydromethanopterin S-methyltransferase subunit B